MKRCYIIGAGFSRTCGLPLAKELTGLAWNHWAKEAASVFGDDEHGPYMRETLQSMYPSCDFDESWPDFEDMMTMLDEQELFRQAFEGKGSRDRLRAEHWTRAMRQHMSLAIQERTIAAKSKPEFNKVMEFVDNVSQTSSTIVSFNWDLLVECAAHGRINIDYGCGESNNVATIPMAKPHGSMNLIEDDPESGCEFGKLRNVPGLSQIFTTKHQPAKPAKVVMCATDPWNAEHDVIRRIREESKVLVAPTARKVYDDHDWISLQWKLAAHLVQCADEIVIIGFSLPDTDFRPRLLLQLACVREGRPRQPRIVLIDPKACVLACSRYLSAVPAPIVPIESAWTSLSDDFWLNPVEFVGINKEKTAYAIWEDRSKSNAMSDWLKAEELFDRFSKRC